MSDNEREAMERALVMAGVKEPELYGPFLAALHAGYYRSSEDFVGASREGLVSTGLPPALIDRIMRCQLATGNSWASYRKRLSKNSKSKEQAWFLSISKLRRT